MRRLSLVALLLAVGLGAGASPSAEERGAISADLLARCVARVEKIRGVSFERPVPAAGTTPEEYRERMLGDMERLLGGRETLSRLEILLRDLGQIGPDETVAGIAQRFFPDSVAASYDPERERIEVLHGFRSATLLCHELTHALDDQRFDLMAMFGDGRLEFDRLLALGALVEGSAESVEMTIRTRGALPLVPVFLLRQEGERRVEEYLWQHRDVPRLLARAFIFQYLSGLVFVESVKRRRLVGWAALDEAFGDPPRTTEQVLHPGKYFDREGPAPLEPFLPAGWSVAAENVLGELGTIIALEGFGADLFDARRAAEGWGADRIAHLTNEAGEGVFVWDTVWDTDADAGEFFDVARTGLRGGRRRASETLAISVDVAGRVDLLVRADRRVTLLRGVPSPRLAALRRALLPPRIR